MDSAVRATWLGTLAGLGALLVGLGVFFLYAMSEVLANPGISFVDGYWIGRLPWTGIGEGFTVIGATVAVVMGTVTVWLSGHRTRRLLVLAPLAVSVFFWILAMRAPPDRAQCAGCPEPIADPFAYAYSLPEQMAALLLIPMIVIAVLAFTARPRRAPGA